MLFLVFADRHVRRLVDKDVGTVGTETARRSISSATERRNVATVSIMRSRRASAERLSAWRAAK